MLLELERVMYGKKTLQVGFRKDLFDGQSMATPFARIAHTAVQMLPFPQLAGADRSKRTGRGTKVAEKWN